MDKSVSRVYIKNKRGEAKWTLNELYNQRGLCCVAMTSETDPAYYFYIVIHEF